MSFIDLRVDPVTALNSYNYFVRINPRFQVRPEGFSIEITEELQHKVYRWDVRPSSRTHDYFFPYSESGLGILKLSNPLNRTIVATGPLCGCGLHVTYNSYSKEYTFYHDKNEKHIHGLLPGCVCHIGCEDYWDDRKYDEEEAKGAFVPIVQFIFVYKDGFWHVGASGIRIPMVNHSHDNLETFFPIGGKYRGRFNSKESLPHPRL